MASYSQILTVKIQAPTCSDNAQGIYLRWLNSLGTWDGWFFTGKKVRSLNTEGIFFQSTDGRNNRTLRKEGTEAMTLRASGLTQAQVLAMRDLFTSPAVFVQNQVGSLTEVSIKDGDYKLIDEVEKKQSLEFNILLPNLNALTN